MSRAKQPPHRNRKTGQLLENRQQVCPVCFENFNSSEAGDAHRRLNSMGKIECVFPGELGLLPIENRFKTIVWRTKDDIK